MYFLGGKGGRCVRLTTLPPSCAVVMKSGKLNFVEPSGPLQACNGTASRFTFQVILFWVNMFRTFSVNLCLTVWVNLFVAVWASLCGTDRVDLFRGRNLLDSCYLLDRDEHSGQSYIVSYSLGVVRCYKLRKSHLATLGQQPCVNKIRHSFLSDGFLLLFIQPKKFSFKYSWVPFLHKPPKILFPPSLGRM